MSNLDSYITLCQTYYQMGVAHMDAGRPAEAMLFLSRADTIYSAKDEIYEAVGSGLTDDCSERIGTLEEEPTLHNDFPQAVEELAEQLDEDLIRVWGLFTLCRLVKIGERLSALPGCECFGELRWAAEFVLRSFQQEVTGAQLQRLQDIGNTLYELTGSPAYFAGGAVGGPGGPDFEVFDLNGLLVPEELMMYLTAHVDRITGEASNVVTEIIPCALPIDYCLRTAGQEEGHPLIQREIARIQSDLDFLRTGPTWAAVNQRAAAYMDLDILSSES